MKSKNVWKHENIKIYKYGNIQIYMKKNINAKNVRVCEESKYIYEKLWSNIQ